jgi:hypothetical protein
MEKHILDDETRKQLLGYLPFGVGQTVFYTPQEYKALKIDECFKPIFSVRSLTQAEFSQLKKNSMSLREDPSIILVQTVADSNLDIVRQCIMGWKNLYDVGSMQEIEYKADVNGGSDKDTFKCFPVWLQTDLMNFIQKISGLQSVDVLGLK